MISTRYTLPVAIVLTIALVPTVIHSYLKLAVDNSATTRNINPIFADFTSMPSRKNPGWGEETFGCTDWFERNYKDQQNNTVRLFVGRGFDHKRLYHHPELALSHGIDLRSNGKLILPGEPAIPVHTLHHSSQSGIAAFVLFYDGHFIDDPIQHQMKSSLKLLINAEKPMTLFYVSEDNGANQSDFTKTPSAKVLQETIKRYLALKPSKTS